MVVCVFKMFVLVTVQSSNLHKKYSDKGQNRMKTHVKKKTGLCGPAFLYSFNRH